MKASSESIHHSDCEARLIVEHMPGFAWSADQDGKLRYLNQRFLEYTGKRIEDFDRVAGVASFGRTEVLHPDDIADTLKAASHSVATGDPYVFEHRVRRFDGTYRWFRVSALRILDPMSQEIGWYGVDIDIDDQKRTDEALRQSEQSLNRLIETLPAMVWRATPDGEPDYINPRLANYTGRGLDGVGRGPEDLGRTLDDLVKLKVQNAMVHQDDLEAAARAWGRAHETGAFDLTARLRGADASYRWFQARAEPMRDAAGRIVYWYGVAVDIDDRKRVEEALQKSEQELRGIVDAIPQTIVVLDADGRGLYANRPLLDYTGLTMEQLLTPDSRGNPVLFHPDDWARLQDERRQALSRSMPFEIEWRVRRKDGQYRWFLVRYHPLRDEQGRILRWYAGGTDIDDRKRAEEALRHSEQELRVLIETLPAMVWRTTGDGEPDYINQRFADYLGRSLAELAQQRWQDVVHPEDAETAARAWSLARDTATPVDTTCRFRKADGAYRWFHVHAEPLRDCDGRVVRWYGVNVDVDDRKRAEEALRKSERELRLLIETIPAAVWRATPDGESDYFNQRMARDIGMSQTDLLNLTVRRDLTNPDDLGMVAQEWARARETETAFDSTHKVRAADGSYRWVNARAEPMRDEAGRIIHWYGVMFDIDDHKRAEEALRTTQAKLSRASEIAMVSEMAASIAHEISQPLGALVANGHAIQRWLSAEPPNLERARLTAERLIRDGSAAAEVVNRIRALFKRTDLTRTPLDLNEVIREVNRLMTDEASTKGVRIEIDLADDMPPIWADRMQMQQVIVNLVRNGVEAMESEQSDPRVLSIRSTRDGINSVLIEIRDQGSGLEDVERVFEPFFTTKETGMGMGLAISRWIVEAHQGRVWATSNTPRGAVFSFTLPISSSTS